MLKQLLAFWSGDKASPKLTGEDYELLRTLTEKDEIDEEVAYAAMLLELASIDGFIDPKEEALVARAIKTWFKMSEAKSWETLAKGKQALKSFRPGTSFVKRIRKQYSAAEKEMLISTIQQIINADGVVTEEEKFLAERLTKMLS